jgi:hypothetical protein
MCLVAVLLSTNQASLDTKIKMINLGLLSPELMAAKLFIAMVVLSHKRSRKESIAEAQPDAKSIKLLAGIYQNAEKTSRTPRVYL